MLKISGSQLKPLRIIFQPLVESSRVCGQIEESSQQGRLINAKRHLLDRICPQVRENLAEEAYLIHTPCFSVCLPLLRLYDEDTARSESIVCSLE